MKRHSLTSKDQIQPDEMITDAQRKHYETAINFVASRRDKRETSAEKTWPLSLH